MIPSTPRGVRSVSVIARLGHQFLAPGTTVILDSPCSWDRRAPDLSSRDQKNRRRPERAPSLLPHPVRERTPAVLSQRANRAASARESAVNL